MAELSMKDWVRRLNLRIEQEIREFEQGTGMIVKGFKIKRDKTVAQQIECVIAKIEIGAD